MATLTEIISPRSSSGSFVSSIVVHALIYGTVLFVLGRHAGVIPAPDTYLDLGYQTFEEPPVPVQEVRRVVRAPEPEMPVEHKTKQDSASQELQDAKGDVAGTQSAAPVVNNVGATTGGEAVSTPYYRIKPKYPREALMSGTEGWVLLKIDITESGEVENVRVIDGEQRNTFQGEAKRAVSLWKYRPFTDSAGKVLKKTDYQVRVDFKLTDAASNNL